MSPGAGDTVKFLLVDDREENLVALAALLERDGLEILTANSGDAALELLLVHDVALALVDVQMPEMDGFALAELMRGTERTKHVPIIFVTANVLENNRVFRGYDAGAVDFLIKPVDPRILRHKTETFFQLFKQRQELEATLRLNETFVAAVGHDLRTPLHAIMMAGDLILSETKEPSTRAVAMRLRSSSKRMVSMIDDLFDLARARLDNGVPIERKEVDLLPIVQRVIAELETSGVNRTFRLEHDGSTRGFLDGARLEQVFSNLLGNAVRHGAPGAITVTIRAAENDRVEFMVHNGGAIPDDVIHHIFDPFRSSERRAHAEGLGLGLYIVKQIILAHGGTIDVTSTIEAGTTFRVVLDRQAAAATKTP